ncbi:helix-turn-helix transcriptional regulator [Paenalcaligenes sp. Me52]|uniref:helix-turn-helix transcriptional regulator n=1 Tax=Paenalcaligenes sp. Me52 TaxID=3392038 RepID=UPI003D27952F
MNTTATQNIDHAVQMAYEHTSLLKDQFVNMDFITQYTGLTDKWFYKQIQEGEFPRPVKFGRSSRWLKSEVERWVQVRIDKARAR